MDPRAEILAQMFSAYGQEATAERVAMYAKVVGPVAPERLQAAVLAAMRNTEGGFPPGPGDLVHELRHLPVEQDVPLYALPAPEMPEPGSERWKSDVEPVRETLRRMGLLK